MPNEKNEENKEEVEPTEETVEKELEDLQAELEAPAEEAPAETAAEEPQEVPDFDVRKAALSVIANLSRDEQIEEFKKLGHEIAPARQIQADKEEIAETAQRLTMEQEMVKYRQVVPESDLPPGFYDAEAQDQNYWLAIRTAEIVGKQMNDSEMAPIRQFQQQQEMSAKLDAASASWAAEFGAPGAARQIREFAGTFSEQQIQMLEAEMEAGGGPFSRIFGQNVKDIASAHARNAEKSTEEPLPKSEDVGGGDTEVGGALSGEAQSFMSQARADGIMNKSQLADLEKTLVENL